MSENRVYQKVANQIIEMIDSGAFPPGSRLPAERELAETFGVSRVSVREAAIALQAQGRIEIRAGSGAYVRDGSDLLGPGLPKAGPFELTEARALFEAEAAALAAPMISDEDLDALDAYIAVMSSEDPDANHDEADRLFHLTIAKATKNAAIIHTLENLWAMRIEAAKLQHIYKQVCDGGSVAREAEHRAIVDALRSRDSDAARSAMRAHFTRMIEGLLDASEEQAYQDVKRKAAESRSRYLLASQIGS